MDVNETKKSLTRTLADLANEPEDFSKPRFSLEKIRKRAEEAAEATSHRWHYGPDHAEWGAIADCGPAVEFVYGGDIGQKIEKRTFEQQHAVARYLAAADPWTLIYLLDLLEGRTEQ